MDGTLLDSKHEISSKNIERINYFVQNGGRFTIATGRIESTLGLYTHLLPITDPVILYNGAKIYDYKTDNVLWECCLEDNIKYLLKEIYSTFNKVGLEVFYNKSIYFINENAQTDEHIKREKLIPHKRHIDDIPLPWNKVLLAWEPENLILIERYLVENAPDLRWVYSEKQFLELLNKKVSKGTALEILLGMLSIPVENVIAVGDNLNDFELVQKAGIGYAVSNAHKSIKKIANRISVSNDEHAIANIIQEIETSLLI
jgi:Cof subfamily protein (haloacid dehalogenase superfamily)